MPTSIGAQVSQCRGLQSAYINRRIAPDHFLPIITQGFNPGIWSGPPGPPGVDHQEWTTRSGPPGVDHQEWTTRSGPPGPPQGTTPLAPLALLATPPLLPVTISQHLLKVTVAIGTLGTQ